jgi:acyl-CoA-binding protein
MELETVFEQAAKVLTNSKLKLTNEQKLKFYSLYKQGTIGKCNIPKPGMLEFVEKSKW